MRYIRHYIALLILGMGILIPTLVQAQRSKKGSAKGEEGYYKLLTFTPPRGEVLEAGAIEVLPGNKIAVGTRRGEIWIIDNGLTDDPKAAKVTHDHPLRGQGTEHHAGGRQVRRPGPHYRRAEGGGV